MKSGQFNEFCDFLEVLTKKINMFFENQKEYIHCKEGCSLCCRQGEYPCSELEYEFLRLGVALLPVETQKQITQKVLKIKEDKKYSSPGIPFEYECPFLFDNKCSIYKYRMIICRTFGLPYYINQDGEQRIKTPFCVHHGLNYSEVYDAERNTISQELFEQKGYQNEPVAFNLSLSFILNKLGKESMGLDFGEEKSLIDWL